VGLVPADPEVLALPDPGRQLQAELAGDARLKIHASERERAVIDAVESQERRAGEPDRAATPAEDPTRRGWPSSSVGGAGWASRVSEARLRQVILVLLVLVGIALIVEVFLPGDVVGLLPADPFIRAIAGVILGLAIVLFSSMLGVAGGEVIIPTLVFAFGADIKTAGTASLLVSLPTVLTGLGRYARRGAYADRGPLKITVAPMAGGR
jgi:hypothetical protein